MGKKKKSLGSKDPKKKKGRWAVFGRGVNGRRKLEEKKILCYVSAKTQEGIYPHCKKSGKRGKGFFGPFVGERRSGA